MRGTHIGVRVGAEACAGNIVSGIWFATVHGDNTLKVSHIQKDFVFD